MIEIWLAFSILTVTLIAVKMAGYNSKPVSRMQIVILLAWPLFLIALLISGKIEGGDDDQDGAI